VIEGTFGLWNGERLVPVAKTDSGLSEEDMYEIELFAKEHTIDRFGPVRSLTPELVFTIAFDDVYSSSRHKSGVIVQNPRVVCRQHECAIQDADTLETIQHYIL
jgi:DNA ligase-1